MERAGYPKIVIVGRPNVGKSSLFNRIVGGRRAIVEATCGTTRDRLHADIAWKSKAFTIVDTGGFEPDRQGDIHRMVFRQLHTAIEEADIIFFVTDASSGVVPQDIEFADRLRKTSKKIYLVVNKVDDALRSDRTLEFFELGMGEPFAVSAVNGRGVDKLLDEAARSVAKVDTAHKTGQIRVAIVGRPNVGKSSFVNAILKEERVIVHHTAGTTRDSIDTDFNYKDRDYVLIDTAGIRHNATFNEASDFYASVRAKESVQRCDVAIVMIDGFDGLREDDKRIINFVIDEGKALIVAVNKWDLSESVEMSAYRELLIKSLAAIRHYPVLFISCKTKRNVLSCLDAVLTVYDRSRLDMSREDIKALLGVLNDRIEIKSKRIKFIYLTQEASAPPSFVLGFKNIIPPSENMKRFIENFFRLSRDLEGVPLRIRYDNKFADTHGKKRPAKKQKGCKSSEGKRHW